MNFGKPLPVIVRSWIEGWLCEIYLVDMTCLDVCVSFGHLLLGFMLVDSVRS